MDTLAARLSNPRKELHPVRDGYYCRRESPKGWGDVPAPNNKIHSQFNNSIGTMYSGRAIILSPLETKVGGTYPRPVHVGGTYPRPKALHLLRRNRNHNH